jgi:hypothetical protein
VATPASKKKGGKKGGKKAPTPASAPNKPKRGAVLPGPPPPTTADFAGPGFYVSPTPDALPPPPASLLAPRPAVAASPSPAAAPTPHASASDALRRLLRIR